MAHERRLGGFVPFAAFLLLVSVSTAVPVSAEAQEAGSIAGTAIVTGTDFVVRIQVLGVGGQVVAETTTDGEGGTSLVVFHLGSTT